MANGMQTLYVVLLRGVLPSRNEQLICQTKDIVLSLLRMASQLLSRPDIGSSDLLQKCVKRCLKIAYHVMKEFWDVGASFSAEMAQLCNQLLLSLCASNQDL